MTNYKETDLNLKEIKMKVIKKEFFFLFFLENEKRG